MKRLYYTEKIIYLEAYIEKCEVTPATYGYILSCFDEIKRCNMDESRTARLFHKFTNKFDSIWEREPENFFVVHNQIMR